MDDTGASNLEFRAFKQLENDYSGYQSLTDVPKALVYTEDLIDVQVNNASVRDSIDIVPKVFGNGTNNRINKPERSDNFFDFTIPRRLNGSFNRVYFRGDTLNVVQSRET